MATRLLSLLALLMFVVVGCAPVFSTTTTPAPSGVPDSAAPTVYALPTAIRIPAIGLDSEKTSNQTFQALAFNTDGSMQVPDLKQPTRFGWYCPQGTPPCGAPYPGQTGKSVIVSHVNGGGRAGGFYNLHKVTKGDTIEVDLDSGITNTFKVVETVTASKTKFPVQTVFGKVDHPQLIAVTCGGTLDTKAHSYESNIIVVADEVSSKATP